MQTDPVLTALVLHRCGEAERSKAAVMSWSPSYDFCTGEFFDLSKKTAQAKKPVTDVDGAPTKVTLEPVPAAFHADVSYVDSVSVRQDYDEYRRRESGRSKADRAGASSRVFMGLSEGLAMDGRC